MKKKITYRIEEDSLGKIKVPKDALYGAQTQRAIDNFQIGNDVVISKARGVWIQKEIGAAKPWVIASFHPAFLMRQPEQKKLAWIDLKMIRDKSKILKI